jgi:hypothetical protein
MKQSSTAYLWRCNKRRDVVDTGVEKYASANQAERDVTILEEGVNNREHQEGARPTKRNTIFEPERHHSRVDHA